MKSYNTLFEITSKIIKIFEQPFDKTKIKLNDFYLELPDLKQRISSLTSYNKVALEIYELAECEWFDKAQLFDKSGTFKPEVSDCFKEVFYKYCVEHRKLYPEHIVEIFTIATSMDFISVQDSKVTQIFTMYSQTGEYLTLEEWLNFYYQSSLKNAPLVVSNLVNLGYASLFSNSNSFE